MTIIMAEATMGGGITTAVTKTAMAMTAIVAITAAGTTIGSAGGVASDGCKIN
ncbi:hypothetical protein RRH01S_06_02200 [Rhizobium rhizogenes NBRC 13257]|uniref:Uncharacterized protein n=1 Tax=Rhizobium rhizogenes NBRC 13257 TaxID=1220581 RepID=A0AA87Q9R7_RHIRH|nr:hypothetical protein RRH01S_06_02200 [Rhizobium rhizogenes NBRC 13257]